MLEQLFQEAHVTWKKSANGTYRLVGSPISDPATIRMHAYSESGEPLANHEVHLYVRDVGFGFSTRQTAVWAGVTDGDGVIRIRQFPGVHDWIVHFPGTGQTHTASVVVDPGSEVEIELNRVVPYAAVSGRLDDEVAKSITSESKVHLSTQLAWEYREAAVDAKGLFRIEDVPVTRGYPLKVNNAFTEPIQLNRLRPGEIRSDILIQRPREGAEVKAFAGEELGRARTSDETPQERTRTLRGRVVDEHGNAMAGVNVFATLKFHGGIRMYQMTKEATTDEQGYYQIEDGDFFLGSVALVAYLPGRPLAIGAGGFHGPTTDSHVLVGAGGAVLGRTPEASLPKVLSQPDLVLPAAKLGGALSVKLLRDGEPVQGLTVQLELMDYQSTFSPGWAAGEVPKPLADVLCPSTSTDREGGYLHVAVEESEMGALFS